MVEVGVQPHGVIFFQHGAQLGRYALGHDDGSAAAYADNFHVRNGAQAADYAFELFVGKQQRVAAREQHVAHFGVRRNVLDIFVYSVCLHLAVLLSRKASARAVAAVHGALVGDEYEHAVGIAVRKSRHGAVGILVQRVEQVGVGAVQLFGGGHCLQAHGVERIVQIYQREVVGGDCHAKAFETARDAFLLLGGELYVFFQVVKRFYAVADLPAPIVPVLCGNIGEKLVFCFHNFTVLVKRRFFQKARAALCFRAAR